MNRTEWAVTVVALLVAACVGCFLLMLLEAVLSVASLLS